MANGNILKFQLCIIIAMLGQGKDEYVLYIQITEEYIRRMLTMHVRLTTEGQEVINISIGHSYRLRIPLRPMLSFK